MGIKEVRGLEEGEYIEERIRPSSLMEIPNMRARGSRLYLKNKK